MQTDRRIRPTMLGCVVTDKLVKAFPDIMDVKFTAGMELQLDAIEEQHLDWIKLLRDFYGPFHKTVDGALAKIDHVGGSASPYTCDKCGRPMVYRISGFRAFIFPAPATPSATASRRWTRQGKPKLREMSEHKCPVCGRQMIKRRGRFGEFLGCSGYSIKKADGTPECATIINLDKEGNPMPPKAPPVKTDIKCEKCGNLLLLRDGA